MTTIMDDNGRKRLASPDIPLMPSLRQRRDDVGNGTKAALTVKEVEITNMVLVPNPKQTSRKQKTSSTAVVMADQATEEDEEWHKATYAISLASCDKGSNNQITVNLDKETWQPNAPAISMMEKTRAAVDKKS